MKKAFDLVIGADHPVVAHHLVQGRAVLPGLAYIDLLMVIASRGLKRDCLATQVRDLVIYQPLIVTEEKPARLTIEAQALEGQSWALTVRAAAPATTRYCAAELHPIAVETLPESAEPTLDLAALRAAAHSSAPLETAYEQARRRGLTHSGLMQAHGVIHRYAWGCLIELDVAPRHRALLPDALFHPALIDGAAVASSALEDAVSASAESLYLPLHYGAFYARDFLRTACVARVRVDRIQVANDIRKLDIAFFDQQGRWTATLAELTGKRVRSDIAAPAKPETTSRPARRAAGVGIQGRTLEHDLRGIFAAHLNVAPQRIDASRGFFDMGLASAQMLTILKDIERLTSRRLNPTLLFEHSSIDELIGYLSIAPVGAPAPEATKPAESLTRPRSGQGAQAVYRFAASDPAVADHRVDGAPALMGVTYPCLALDCWLGASDSRPVSLQDIRFHGGPLKFGPDESVSVEVEIAPTQGESAPFAVRQRVDARASDALRCEGHIVTTVEESPGVFDMETLTADARSVPSAEIESWFHTVAAFTLGPTLKSIERAFERADGTLISELNLRGKTHRFESRGLALDPLLLNACYQFGAETGGGEAEGGAFVPLMIERLDWRRPMTERAFVIIGPRSCSDGFISFNATLCDDKGRCVAQLVNASLRRMPSSTTVRAAARPSPKPDDAAAVIGMAGRFPQSYDLHAFWRNLRDGKDCITEIPASRWDWRAYYSEDGEPGSISSKWGGFIEDADGFDPLFFQISPREAEVMDPLERLFLLHCWMAMEDAGYTREALRTADPQGASANVGIYAGVMGQEYPLFAAQAQERIGLGGGLSSVASRMSYLCDFNGPAMAVDTMCSSSLVAIDMACRALASRAINVAFAGGVNLSLHPSKYLMLSRGGFISSKGRCESFGQGGGGYIPAEGVGVLVLKRLADAERDGDHIYGVIRGSAVNHGGRASGYTAPNPAAQAQVIRSAFQRAGIDPADISYVEAHGTGTKLGDPIEIAGLVDAFRSRDENGEAQPVGSCLIGSVKSNIGHCEAAAGVAGVIKALLQMRHGMIAPSLHSSVLNPSIDFSATPFTVNQALSPWTAKAGRRIAGVSSFGAGGVNAHVIVEQHPVPYDACREDAAGPWLILLSARDAARLEIMAGRLLAAIEDSGLDDAALPSVAYTLQVGREAMEHRAAVIVESMDELRDRLKAFSLDGAPSHWRRGRARPDRDAFELFRDEDAGALLATWLNKGALDALARVWVMGVTPDWSALYRPATGFPRPPRRSPLPGHPFNLQRYWIAETATRASDGNSAPAKTKQSSGVAELLRRAWRPAAWPAPSPDEARSSTLILTVPATAALAERLAGLLPNARILAMDALSDQVEPLCGDALTTPTHIVDLCALNPALRNDSSDGTGEWLTALQRLIEAMRLKGARLLCVTCGLEAFLRPDGLTPAPRAAIRACLYRSLGFEYKRLQSGHLDVDRPLDAAELPAQIAEHLFAADFGPHVCMREGRAYRPTLEPVAQTADKAPWRFPEGGVLWVTGGTRGLGLLCARHMVERHGVRKLVLSGREKLPPLAAWSNLLARRDVSASPAILDKIRAIDALRQSGVDVRVLDVDLTDAEAVEQVCEDLERDFGPLGGLIHCAGLGDAADPALIRKSLSGIRKVFAPKVVGLDVLRRAMARRPLSFFLLYSSVCSVIPELAAGQIDYAMANAYMDALAEQAEGPDMLSLQWPSWTETGMGAMQTDAYRDAGLLGLRDEDGLALLDRALQVGRRGALMPALIDPTRWERSDSDSHAGRAETDPPRVGERLAVSAPDELGDTVRGWLASLFSKELKVAPSDLDVRVDFPDYGLDSILMAQILRTINARLETDLAPSLILEHPNLAALSAWLLAHEGPALARAFSRPQEDVAAATAPQESQRSVVAPEPPPGERTLSASAHTPASRNRRADDDIVVVGLSARFPGGETLDAYWRLLEEGRSAIAGIPPQRWAGAGRYRAGLLDAVDRFDRESFHIPPEDFAAMDPQALIVLEECLNLWAHAGYEPQEIRGGAVGVYLGARGRAALDRDALLKARNPIVAAGQNYLAANVSHIFDINGPSVVIDTACSSALVGMSMAAQALRAGEISAAVVGGVSLLDSDHAHNLFEQRGLLSRGPDFHLFDERADGVVLAEGVGLVLLKTAAQARRDGDTIYARIAALSCNNDGRTAGPATPNIERQKEVMRTALRQAGLEPGQIDYIETNGSGSRVADLLELKAIDAVYGGAPRPCALGSMKPNIGHPLCAEGVASFIKATLMIQHRRLAPFLSGQQALRHFDMDASPFYFPRTSIDAPAKRPLTIALNCFADGGNNVHAILQAPPEADHAAPPWRRPLARPVLRRVARAPERAEPDPAHAFEPVAQTSEAAMIWEQLS